MALPLPTRISGKTLSVLAKAARTSPARFVFSRLAKGDLGLDALLALPPSARGAMAAHYLPMRARKEHGRPAQQLETPYPEPALPLAETLVRRYLAGEDTPVAVLRRVIDASKSLGARSPGMNPLLYIAHESALRDAEGSAKRYAEGKPLGPLDGVPVTVKEQTAIAGLPLQGGTSYLPNTKASEDAVLVARLRAAGAIIVGQTMMTEFGMSPVGYNAQRVMPKNPHHAGCSAGGSSTGAGVSVATGLVPLAIGADGGGSIRTPSAVNGVFGIKPTFGRVSRTGDIFGGSMCHLGPIGRSARELAMVLDAISGEDPADVLTHGTPNEPAMRGIGRGVLGVRIGVPESEWNDAEPAVRKAGKAALDALEGEGAILVPIKTTLFKHAPAIGYLTIGIEAYSELLEIRESHLEVMGEDLQFFLSIVREVEPDSYIDAQRFRTALRQEVATHLRMVDVIAMPTLPGTAPRVSDTEIREGFVDPKLLADLCRFAFLGNLTGLPAASCPVGKDADGLPIGLQILGDAFDEACVLQVVDHLERIGVARAEKPTVFVKI